MSICPIAEQDLEGAISAEIANSSFPGRPLKYPASLGTKMYDKSRDIHKIAIFGIRRNFTVRKSKNGWKFYVAGKVVLHFTSRRM